ncbi:MAG: CaiB/BaiF CoA transferase family protein [Salinirussus sp.]
MSRLEGVRVLDLTQFVAGPMATMHLGDLGADVVKVERPGSGDGMRSFPPAVDGLSAQFAGLNRNKYSVTVDLTTDDGREVLLDLAEKADVFIQNFKSGRGERYGLDYESVSAANPEIIYCSITGFAEGSRYEDLTAFDMIAQAMSGAMSITGDPDGPPRYCGVPMGDIAAGTYAAQSILASLYGRDVGDGGGEYIEVSLMNAMIGWLGYRISYSLVQGEPFPRRGNAHGSIAPYKVFETQDSYLAVSVASNSLWPRFCEAIDRPDLVDRPEFETVADRAENRGQLYNLLEDVFTERTTDAWFERMRDEGVPAGPVYDTLSVWDDPYTEEEDLREDLQNAEMEGTIPTVRFPVNFGDGHTETRIQPQHLGANTSDVLAELGYDEDDIERLKDEGIL